MRTVRSSLKPPPSSSSHDPSAGLHSTCQPLTSPSAAVVLLGCPKNQVDAEYLLGSFSQAGYGITTEPARADVVVIATCAFLQSAVRESEAAIGRVLRLKRERPATRVVVAGCLVERSGPDLPARFPAVDLWVRLKDIARIPDLLGARPRCAVPARMLSTPPHLAYLRIADGCDNRCSYCLIPDIRGRFRSRPVPDILAEARALARSGVRELIIVAQDTTRYGRDIYRRPALAQLLRRLAAIPGVRWLRLMYAHPARVDAALLREFQHNPKLCRYLDLPLQHVNDALLRQMNRHCTRADIEQLLGRLRLIPELRLRSTLIVGFPGETSLRFRELLGFVSSARIERLSAYAFSPEPGTPAFSLPGQVSVTVKRRRLRELMLAQARVSRSCLRRLVGRRITVLVDEPGMGRTEWDAPEVDGRVRFFGRAVRPGAFVRALVTGSGTHDLTARVLQSRPAR
jgi:ribosomal protein S12 methylthiotransferase